MIELLINLAIVGALVGIAAPLYSGFIHQGNSARAEYDLEVFRGAINRYYRTEGILTGANLGPLLGRFLTEIPMDPWGNDYPFDGSLGLVGTFGADGMPWGRDVDEDIMLHYNPYVVPVRAWYEGPFGRPRPANRVILKLARPFVILPELMGEVANDVILVKSPTEFPIPLQSLGFRLDPARTKPLQGLLVLAAVNPTENVDNIPVRAHDVVNLAPLVLSLAEVATVGGPLDEIAELYMYGPIPVEGPSGGVKMERGGP